MKRNFQLIKIGIVAAMICCLVRPGRPCGPFFPNSILEQTRKAWLLAPAASFRAELENQHLIPRRIGPTDLFANKPSKTITTDIQELEEVLTQANIPDHATALNHYKEIREAISRLNNQSDDAPVITDEPPVSPQIKAERLLSGLNELSELGVPAEFTLYLKGAICWHIGQKIEAAKFWNQLLELPAGERHYRSTWAAYMLAKGQNEGEPGAAHEGFDLVRRLAAVGFADSLKMAADSDGWDALVYLNEGKYAKAAEFYLRQKGSDSAVQSLRIVAAKALDNASASELTLLAANDTCRKIITSFLISRGLREITSLHEETETDQPANDPKEERLPKWLAAIETAGIKNDELAERLALAEYQNGNMDAAQRWISAAPRSIAAQWLQAKLHFYNGRLEEAAQVLREAAQNASTMDAHPIGASLASSLSSGDISDYSATPALGEIFAELGSIELNRENFIEALDAFMKAHYWQDAAFVSERVLKIEELKEYVDENCPVDARVGRDEDKSNLRSLLARRLMRLNRFTEAQPYLRPLDQSAFNQLLASLTVGGNENESSTARAHGFFQAALITRKHGMELLGTELEPDWSIYQGSYDLGSASERRLHTEPDSLPPSPSEIERIRASRPALLKRFHYRYTAAEVGWLAAALMPNNSDETARVLCESGSWIKYLDPPRADRFYKSLVRRCRSTEIGSHADQMRWFPVLDEQGKLKSGPVEPLSAQAEPSVPMEE